MRAMVLAAGLGSRLRPLTKNWPKCLMPVANEPLLQLTLKRLTKLQVAQAVVNTHYLAPLVRNYIRTSPYDINLHISHEAQLLGTGGALVKARRMLGDEPFWVMNADVWCDADLSAMPGLMHKHKAIACLGLVDDARFNSVAIDDAGAVLGVKGYVDLPLSAKLYTYSGLAWLHPRLLEYLPSQGPGNIVDAWHGAIKAGHTILGVKLVGQWSDLGAWQDLWACNKRAALPNMVLLGPGAAMHPSAQVQGFCFLGPNSKIGAHAFVKDSVLLSGARIQAHAWVERVIVGKDALLQGTVKNGPFA